MVCVELKSVESAHRLSAQLSISHRVPCRVAFLRRAKIEKRESAPSRAYRHNRPLNTHEYARQHTRIHTLTVLTFSYPKPNIHTKTLTRVTKLSFTVNRNDLKIWSISLIWSCWFQYSHSKEKRFIQFVCIPVYRLPQYFEAFHILIRVSVCDVITPAVSVTFVIARWARN